MTGKNEENELWIRRFNPRDDSKLRLVCLPHAGGSASFYYPMASAVPHPVDVLAVQYPGRQDRRREPGITSIQALADEVTKALEPWTDQPLALFGHSMGATLAFEVARRLESRHGVVPAALFASGRRAPSRPRNEAVHRLGDDGLIAEIKALSGTDSHVLGDEELLRMVLPAIRADYRAAETYVYEPGEKLRCPVIGLVGDNDPKVTVDEARSWGDHTEGPFDFHIFDGGHFYLLHHRAAIIKMISDHLLDVGVA
ncbi:thioesterase [Streptomyces triculaminicus]|uniref:Thioesterase n=3 Tax=Streptomyces TaxID=1883 RepID=A0A939FR43_9ACTN|nr:MULTISPECIES: alpha/beta fold hydrolase [Streptomyces]MBO0656333.1 thioesterase [Streptomyces triculaminicus]QSY50311.1 thioesterase [Streptomyces griseocarneus]